MKRVLTGASGLALTVIFSGQGLAQTRDSADDGNIIVTGTRSVGLRAADSPAPVQIVDSTVLAHTGTVDVTKSLALTIPSLQAQTFGLDSSAFKPSYRLRSLSANETLVLMDGKRRHSTANLSVGSSPYSGGAAPDISYIPSIAIDHIEVLQEGAAAQYGTDAIAGVVNIILKKSASGGSLNARAGSYFDGGGFNTTVAGNAGFGLLDKGYLNVSVENKGSDTSFRGDIDPRVSALTASGRAALVSYPLIGSNPDYPYVNRIASDPVMRQTNVVLTAGYDISPAAALYMDGSFGHKTGKSYQSYRLPSAALYNGVPAYPSGFSPRQSFKEDDYAGTIGVKGAVADMTYDLSSTYGRDSIEYSVIDSINSGLYSATGASPRTFRVGNFIATQWTTNLDLTHEIPIGSSKPLLLAAGAEYRRDTYELKAGEPLSYQYTGSQSFVGFSPQNAGNHHRSNYSLYADALLKSIPRLTIDGAVRYEHYTDFGDTTVFKGTGRYDFSDAIAVRGTASTGFRAPTLAEEYYSAINSGPNQVAGTFAPNSAGSALLGIGGLKPEKSTNYSAGLVVHPAPRLTVTLDGYEITVKDRIVQTGNIYGYSTNRTVVTSPAVLSALAQSGITIDPSLFTLPSADVYVRTFVNGVDTRTRGADLVVNYAIDLNSAGKLDLSLSGSYVSTKITRVAPPPSNVAQSVVLLDAVARSFIEHSVPKTRVTGNAFWQRDKWAVNLRTSFYGSSYIYQLDPVLAQNDKIKIDPVAIVDLNISYNITDDIQLIFGANNLFNTYPAKTNAQYRQNLFATTSSTYTYTVYPSFGPFGFMGGSYYAGVNFEF